MFVKGAKALDDMSAKNVSFLDSSPLKACHGYVFPFPYCKQFTSSNAIFLKLQMK